MFVPATIVTFNRGCTCRHHWKVKIPDAEDAGIMAYAGGACDGK